MSHAFDSKALELSRKTMGLMYGPMPVGGSCQLQAQIQNLFIEAMGFAAPAVQAEQTKLLIGWRTTDYTEETSDPEMAKNWAAVVGVLPVFEGDINTRLQAEQLSGNTEQVEPVSAANKLGGWTPVSERMPEDGEHVIVFHPGDGVMQITFFFAYGKWWDAAEDDSGRDKYYFTHWMPLPAAPKQEAE